MHARLVTAALVGVALMTGCSSHGTGATTASAGVANGALPPAQAARTAAAGPSARYFVAELASLGDSFSFGSAINEPGIVVGASLPAGGSALHAALWRDGSVRDLGTLGGPNSVANVLNNAGLAGGFSETAETDPLGEDFCQNGTGAVCTAVVWDKARAIPLPTFGGHNASVLFGLNDRGEAVGAAETATHDATCPAPQLLQLEAALWKPAQGTVQQLPPLAGDTNGEAFSINQRGEVVGSTGTCANVFPNGIAATHAVIWREGKAVDLGSLGGSTNVGAFYINNRSQVVGASNLPGDATHHGFFWQNGVMTDLGTLPGDRSSKAFWMNDNAEVVGISCGGGNCRAAYWKDGIIADLNDLVQPGSGLFLISAFGINASGAITGYALDTRTSAIVAFLATPSAVQATAQNIRRPAGRMTLPESARQQLHKLATSKRGALTD